MKLLAIPLFELYDNAARYVFYFFSTFYYSILPLIVPLFPPDPVNFTPWSNPLTVSHS